MGRGVRGVYGVTWLRVKGDKGKNGAWDGGCEPQWRDPKDLKQSRVRLIEDTRRKIEALVRAGDGGVRGKAWLAWQ